jgi:HSP20 family molecular chaperone IbpA
MAAENELQVQEKREVAKKEEATVPTRSYLPETDIYETGDALVIVMEMPGVDKSNLDIDLENDVLTVVGRIDFSKYEKLMPIYSEYNIGHYRRQFSLSNRVDQDRISAEVKDGVLTLKLPKAEASKARKIAIA